MDAAKRRKRLRRKIISALLLVGALTVVFGLILTSMKGTAELRRAIGANYVSRAKETAEKTDLAISRELLFLHMILSKKTLQEVPERANARYQELSREPVEHLLTEEEGRWTSFLPPWRHCASPALSMISGRSGLTRGS